MYNNKLFGFEEDMIDSIVEEQERAMRTTSLFLDELDKINEEIYMIEHYNAIHLNMYGSV